MGLGAIAAAAKHGKFELDKLATWQAGQPVPFAFLADTFEAIAEESKRLVITSLLVCCTQGLPHTPVHASYCQPIHFLLKLCICTECVSSLVWHVVASCICAMMVIDLSTHLQCLLC